MEWKKEKEQTPHRNFLLQQQSYIHYFTMSPQSFQT